MSDFLLELRCEEIPARMQAGARAELAKLFAREMDAAGVALGEVQVFSTPRRLALIAKGLPQGTEAVREEAKGPPVGAPDAAVDGFCKKNGVTRDQLEERDVKGRATWFAVIEKPGRATSDVLAAAIPAIIRDFSWPKSMRWGAASLSTESLRWVRPLSGIVALLGDDLVECEVGGIVSDRVTLGHRFHSSGDIVIANAGEYAAQLRAGHVIVDHEERQTIVREGAAKAAAEAGLTLVADEGLVIENAGLTEWPVPLLGRFDEGFLDVPPEVIQLTARVNQKYFVCEDAGGKLANAFVCTANIAAEDGGAAIVDGNRKVLAARLSDARFFWELDQKTSLAVHAEKLARITFHEKLGTVADKVERVAKLARWLVEEGIVKPTSAQPELADLAEQAARLCKADLVTEMVGEFPELQGLMGGYYAEKEGLPQEVADAIRDHYKPVGQGDDVPTAPVTVAVSLADKLDTLCAFDFVDEVPTGSRDPFAIRRQSISVISQVLKTGIRLPIYPAFQQIISEIVVQAFARLISGGETTFFDSVMLGLKSGKKISRRSDGEEIDFYLENQRIGRMDKRAAEKFEEQRHLFVKAFANDQNGVYQSVTVDWRPIQFIADRLKVQQREAGVRHDLIDAIFALGGEDDLVRLLARVHALQSFMATEDGTNLLAGYKRAANILKKEDWDAVAPQPTGDEDPLENVDDPQMREIYAEQAKTQLSYEPEPAEAALISALAEAEPRAAMAVAKEDFAAAMAALASLRAPIDAFFDNVTVNDPDQDKRKARLDLLAQFRVAVHKVADFSKIEG